MAVNHSTSHKARAASAVRLVVFSDDWGRHPSSCQHLVRHLLDRYPVTWVNTIGTRRPRLSREDVGKAAGRLRQWVTGRRGAAGSETSPTARPAILTPLMFPGFRGRWQRKLNANLLTRSVNRALGPRVPGEQRIAVTTIPITADLVGRIDVDRWVYYCVDDFSAWPGLDGSVMDAMERQLARRVDAVAAVSQTLVERIGSMGAAAQLLTHGIDLQHWQSVTRRSRPLPAWWRALPGPVALFFGVVDQRLDAAWCRALADTGVTVALVGPQQSPPSVLAEHPRIVMPGPVPYADLPALAAAAAVLVMPYADLPVTRAIQPLKLKEYLATGRPALVRDLPATRPWRDACDVVADAASFVTIAQQRITTGTPACQQQARRRLDHESWHDKAQQFERVLVGTISPGQVQAASAPLRSAA